MVLPKQRSDVSMRCERVDWPIAAPHVGDAGEAGVITPKEYFEIYPMACFQAKEFCNRFNTMREAWDAEPVNVDWMLWALGRNHLNIPGLKSFIRDVQGLVDSPAYARVADSVFRAMESAPVLRLFVLAIDTADMHANPAEASLGYIRTRDRRRLQRAKLRELFPNQFMGEWVKEYTFNPMKPRDARLDVLWQMPFRVNINTSAY